MEDLYFDIFIYERPGSDTSDKEWREAPLIFHDRGVVEAANSIMKCYADGLYNFTATMSKILRRHPGPIKYFRLDSSICPGPEILEKWMELLSNKEVGNLFVFNISQPTDMTFPLHLLESNNGLNMLGLGYFKLQFVKDDLLRARFPCLQQLILEACSFDVQALSSVISNCTALDTLKLSYSNLSAGCRDGAFVKCSGTLKSVVLWRCVASSLCLEYAPALHSLSTGVLPGYGNVLRIEMQFCHALQCLNCFSLKHHKLYLGSGFTTKSQGRRIVSFPSLQVLEVDIHMNDPMQTSGLLKLLLLLPQLEKLKLKVVDRDDTASPNTAATETALRGLQSLKYFEMMGFMGRSSEISFISNILLYSESLDQIEVFAARPEEAAEALRSCQRASKDCQVYIYLLRD